MDRFSTKDETATQNFLPCSPHLIPTLPDRIFQSLSLASSIWPFFTQANTTSDSPFDIAWCKQKTSFFLQRPIHVPSSLLLGEAEVEAVADPTSFGSEETLTFNCRPSKCANSWRPGTMASANSLKAFSRSGQPLEIKQLKPPAFLPQRRSSL
mmetsp:Transcript_38363/g.75320  ORF Transcript_38363/g.75320 Transcript_38363/m.75320 type:complete len:153 (+) Transcript_38363:216-674(+)